MHLHMDNSLQTVVTHQEGVIVWGPPVQEGTCQRAFDLPFHPEKKTKVGASVNPFSHSLSISLQYVVVYRIYSMEQCRWTSCTSVARSLPVLTTVVPSLVSTYVAAEHIQVSIAVPCYFTISSLILAYRPILRF